MLRRSFASSRILFAPSGEPRGAGDRRLPAASGRGSNRSALGIAEQVRGKRHVLALSGEIDIANASLLEQKVVRLCDTGAREIVLDLRGLSFIDARGLSAILFCKRRCEYRAVAFSMVPGSRMVRRLFELTGLDEQMPFRDAPDARLAAAPIARKPRCGAD